VQGQRYWIKSGTILFQDPRKPVSLEDEALRLHRDGQVRLTTGPLGTEVKWDLHTPCFSSVILAATWLEELNAPVILRFNATGWFEETFETAFAAAERMQDILARGDRHIVSRVFVNQPEQTDCKRPKVIRKCLEEGAPDEAFSVDCNWDERSGKFSVARVGPQSGIGRLWGTFTTSQPCKVEAGYDDVVAEAYSRVMETGRPHYDQVMALFHLPNRALHWIPYHRAVFPKDGKNSFKGVSVVSQIASVDFTVI
jgi:hypothetical protein